MVDIESNAYSLPTVLPVTPPGLNALYLACRNIYPDQPNPLQVSAVVKFWLGGPDPLDYISMYSNTGNVDLGVPPHWHYISFGFSDLHGDGRVHEANGPDDTSGFGFELTFRLKREPGELSPPTWPAQLLQALAKYVFHSDNVLTAGDHIAWNKALDSSESLIEHMLLLEDPQLGTVCTPNGTVQLLQIVGVTKTELEAAQHWTPHGVLDILKKLPGGGGGGEWLVTDMRRGMSMYELDPNSAQSVKEGIEKEGSNLSGVTSFCFWKNISLDIEKCDNEEEKGFSKYANEDLSSPPPRSGAPWLNEELQPPELLPTKTIERPILVFNRESGSLLRLAIRGRVMHGRHFTFKSVAGDCVITFVGEGVSGTNVDPEKPYVAMGSWLQVLIPESFAEELASQFDSIESTSCNEFPKTFKWAERGLSITIEDDLLTRHPAQQPVF